MGGLTVIRRIQINGRGRQKVKLERWQHEKESTGSKSEGSQGMQLEVERSKETDSVLEPPRGQSPADTMI